MVYVEHTRLGFILLSFLIAVSMASVAQACIGEVAGKIGFNVSAGSSETLQMQIFNSCANQTIQFATISQVNPVVNATSPTIVMSPKNGTLDPRVNTYINITVTMPANAVVGTVWSAGAAADEVVSNNTNGQGGAILNVGVIKLFNITALPAKPIPLIDIIIGAAAVVAAGAAGGSLYYFRVMKKGAKKPARAAKKAPRKRATRKRPAKRTSRSAKKRTTRRRRR